MSSGQESEKALYEFLKGLSERDRTKWLADKAKGRFLYSLFVVALMQFDDEQGKSA